MTFFDPPQPPPIERTEPYREPWKGDSVDTVGVPLLIVKLLVRTEEVAVIVSGFVAYPSGFSLNLISIKRFVPTPSSFVMGHPRTLSEQMDFLRFGMRFSDGSKVTNVDPMRSPGKRILQGRGGGGGGRKYSRSYWCAPLPSAGELALVCEWPRYGVATTEVTIDADPIIAAGNEAEPIWKDDVGIPEPRSTWGTGGTGWTEYGPLTPLK